MLIHDLRSPMFLAGGGEMAIPQAPYHDLNALGTLTPQARPTPPRYWGVRVPRCGASHRSDLAFPGGAVSPRFTQLGDPVFLPDLRSQSRLCSDFLSPCGQGTTGAQSLLNGDRLLHNHMYEMQGVTLDVSVHRVNSLKINGLIFRFYA